MEPAITSPTTQVINRAAAPLQPDDPQDRQLLRLLRRAGAGNDVRESVTGRSGPGVSRETLIFFRTRLTKPGKKLSGEERQ